MPAVANDNALIRVACRLCFVTSTMCGASVIELRVVLEESGIDEECLSEYDIFRGTLY